LELRDGTSACIGSIVVFNRLHGGEQKAEEVGRLGCSDRNAEKWQQRWWRRRRRRREAQPPTE
jgi:hypothetical protein